jgi:rare lipoprotein A (peptidoglycan hydrolase)
MTKTIYKILLFAQIGIASWYGLNGGSGNYTANGERFDPCSINTIASNTIPLNSWVEVENISNGIKVKCKVTDRGGFTELGRIADLPFGVMCVLTNQRWRIKSLNSRGLPGLIKVRIRRIVR